MKENGRAVGFILFHLLLLLAPPALAESPDTTRLMATVRHLSVAIGARPAGSMAHDSAAIWIARQFREMGYAVAVERFPLPAGGYAENVLAWINDDHDRETRIFMPSTVIIGAHLDTVRGAPGADDNASGIAVILEAARLTRRRADLPDVLWVAFGAEEKQRRRPTEHHLGSRHLARVLDAEGSLPQAMISVDGVGVEPSLRVLSMEIPEAGDFTPNLLLRAARDFVPTAYYQKDPGRDGWSDHEPFERLGVSSAWLVRRKNLRLHSAADRYATIRPEHLTGAVRVLIRFLERYETDLPHH